MSWIKKYKIHYLANVSNTDSQTEKQKLIHQGIECFDIPVEIDKICEYLKKHLTKYNDYDVAHIHVTSGTFYKIGLVIKKHTETKVIFHGHTYLPGNFLVRNIQNICYRYVGDYFMACSNRAAVYMFGKKILNSNKYLLAKNAIDTNRFIYNEELRNKIRNEYNVQSTLFGFVGRLSKEKNINMIIDVFNNALKIKNDIKLMIVGDGNEKQELMKYTQKLKIEDKVIFTGSKKNIEEYMNAFDVFLLPSEFESLGIVLIEAQACGLGCVVSSGVVKDSCITDLWNQMPSQATIDEWSNAALELSSCPRHNRENEIKKAGYEWTEAIKHIENVYDSLTRKKRGKK